MRKKENDETEAPENAKKQKCVPGGPKSKTPFQGSLIPVKNSGMSKGSTMASFKSLFAFDNAAMSSNVTAILC